MSCPGKGLVSLTEERQQHLVITDRALEETIRLLDRQLRDAARIVAGGDRAWAADLHQEALIFIWQLDPARFAPAQRGYLLNAAIGRMLRLAQRDEMSRLKIPIAARF